MIRGGRHKPHDPKLHFEFIVAGGSMIGSTRIHESKTQVHRISLDLNFADGDTSKRLLSVKMEVVPLKSNAGT